MGKPQIREEFHGSRRLLNLADQVDGRAALLPVGHGRSRYFSFFESDENFVLVAPDHEDLLDDVDFALALGLGYAGERQLHLILPRGTTKPTEVRSAFFDRPLQLWKYAGDSVSPVEIPSRDAALRDARDWGSVAEFDHEKPAHAFADGTDWVIDLMDWAMTRRVDTAVLKSYVAWHYRGRQVLRIKRTKNGFRIEAGVQYTKGIPPSQPQPISREFLADAPPTEPALTQIRQAVDAAIENRRLGLDAGHQEHAFQAAIRGLSEQFGMVGWTREFPAARPESPRALIDFAGVDSDDTLHVVETKLGPDKMLVLQGLDYWMWATAHTGELASQFGVRGLSGVAIDFVVGDTPGKSLVHPLTATQAVALSPAVRWRFHRVSDWRDPKLLKIQSFGERSPVPVA